MLSRVSGGGGPAGPRGPGLTGAGSVDRDVAKLNIEHFRRLLREKTMDDAKRLLIERLLADEEAKLASLDDQTDPPDDDD